MIPVLSSLSFIVQLGIYAPVDSDEDRGRDTFCDSVRGYDGVVAGTVVAVAPLLDRVYFPGDGGRFVSRAECLGEVKTALLITVATAEGDKEVVFGSAYTSSMKPYPMLDGSDAITWRSRAEPGFDLVGKRVQIPYLLHGGRRFGTYTLAVSYDDGQRYAFALRDGRTVSLTAATVDADGACLAQSSDQAALLRTRLQGDPRRQDAATCVRVAPEPANDPAVE